MNPCFPAGRGQMAPREPAAGLASLLLTLVATSVPATAIGEEDESGSDAAPEIVDLAVGGQHVCAAAKSGRVFCWGRNHFGQLGDGTTEDREHPVRAAGIREATSVSAGVAHTCALLRSGRVSCWGAGVGGTHPTPVRGPSTRTKLRGGLEVQGCDMERELGEIVELASGAGQTCALHESGSVLCWGSYPLRTYGVDPVRGSTELSGDLAGSALGGLRGGGSIAGSCPVPVWGLEEVETIDAGPLATCAVHRDDELSCWGGSEPRIGPMALDDQGRRVERASGGMVRIEEPGGWRSVEVGAFAVCAVREGGTWDCMGRIPKGGRGVRTERAAKYLGQLSWAEGTDDRDTGNRDMAAGQFCAVSRSGESAGRVRCAGDRGWAAGSTPETGSSTRFAVPGISEARRIALGGRLDAARQPDDLDGRLLDDGPRLQLLSYGIDRDRGFGCVTLAGGGVACWGANTYGQLGDGTTETRSKATPVDFDAVDEERPPPGPRRRFASSEAVDPVGSATDREQSFGSSDHPNRVTVRFGDRSRTFHLPELDARVTEEEELRIAVPEITIGSLGEDSIWQWEEIWKGLALFVGRPSEDPKPFDMYDELPAELGSDFRARNQSSIAGVPIRRRGFAEIDQWEKPWPGEASGGVEGRIELGTGPASFGRITLEFDLDEVRARPDRLARPASGGDFFERDGERHAVESGSVRYDPRAAELEVTLRAETDENRNFGVISSKEYELEDFPGQTGVYFAADRAWKITTFDDRGVGATLYRTRPGDDSGLLAGLDRAETLPDSAEPVAKFEVDTYIRTGGPETVYYTRELEGMPALQRQSFSLGPLEPRPGVVGFESGASRGQPPPSVPVWRELLLYDRASADEATRVRVRRNHGRQGLLMHPGVSIETRLDSYTIDPSRSSIVDMRADLEAEYHVEAETADQIEESLDGLEARPSRYGAEMIEFSVPTRVRAELDSEEISIEAQNSVQGVDRATYPVHTTPVPLAALPSVAGGVELAPGEFTSFRAVSFVEFSARPDRNHVELQNVPGRPSISPARLGVWFTRVRLAVVAIRPAPSEAPDDQLEVVRVAASDTPVERYHRTYLRGAETGRLYGYDSTTRRRAPVLDTRGSE